MYVNIYTSVYTNAKIIINIYDIHYTYIYIYIYIYICFSYGVGPLKNSMGNANVYDLTKSTDHILHQFPMGEVQLNGTYCNAG